jgi:hypothetical protein
MSSHRARKAYSLLEVVLASAICATALVPALAFLRDGMALGDAIDTRHLLLIHGVSKLEERLAVVAAGWSEGTIAGDFAADGHANIRYIATQSDDAAAGGIADRLMSVSVTTYSDEDGDDALDPGELQTTMTTKIGKFISYENKASG